MIIGFSGFRASGSSGFLPRRLWSFYAVARRAADHHLLKACWVYLWHCWIPASKFNWLPLARQLRDGASSFCDDHLFTAADLTLCPVGGRSSRWGLWRLVFSIDILPSGELSWQWFLLGSHGRLLPGIILTGGYHRR